MSSGSYNVGSMPYTTYVSGIGYLWVPGNIGFTASKSWSGTNRPKTPAVWIDVPRINPRWKGEGDTTNDKWYWVRKKARGYFQPQNPTSDEHAYSCTWERVHHPATLLLNDANDDGSWDLGGWCAPAQASMWFNPTASVPWTGNDDIALVGKLRSKVVGTDFNLGVALAEIDKTVLMIADHARIIRKTGLLVRKGRFSDALSELTSYRKTKGLKTASGLYENNPKRIAKTYAQKQLEWVYGVKPLLEDVQHGAEALSAELNVPRQRVYRASRERKIADDPYAFFNASRPPDGWYAYAPVKSYIGKKVGIKLIVTEVNPVQLSGITDVKSILWERTPWSFVIDWFIPVGQWLEALSFQNAVSGTYVVSTKNEWWWSGIKSLNKHAAMYTYGDVPIGMRSGSFTRTISSSPPVSPPTFKPIGKIASVQHCINAVSLLIASNGSANSKRF